MGEIEAYGAELVRSRYVQDYERIKENLGMNFRDMDFTNAKQREEMEEIIRQMEAVCEACIHRLGSLHFF